MIPIRKVVLYKHGVGYFEHEGEIEGEASVELHFKSDEMNDVLKSLTVLDLSGGHISSISYESTKPFEKQLEDIAIRLSDENALTDLLSQIKGARVTVNIGTDEVTGMVAGIETVNKYVDNVSISTSLLTLMVNGATLKTFDIMEISKITLLDDSLRTDLAHLLDVLFSSKKKDAKKLTIFASGEGTRTLLASYVVETPVWKASYRVLLGKDSKPTIQSWALVDNTQNEDWKNVNLTLVSGLPISFVHDLYSPRYKRRPIVQVQEEEAYAPPVLEEASYGAFDEMECESMPCEAMSAGAPLMKAVMPPPSAMPARSRSVSMSREEARAVSTPVQTRTVETGDLFQYEITNPVTVKRNQSALVPIIQTELEGKRVAVYNQEIRDKNPMSSLFLKNTTDLTLEGGPLTVLENDLYVGESMLETLKPQEERLIPFSVELGCLITRETSNQRQSIHRIRITGGYLYLDYHHLIKNTYVIKNKRDKDLDLFLEYRFNHNWELVDTPKPFETTENFYRFRFDVPAGKTKSFTVTEKQQQFESYSLRYNLSNNYLSYWVEQGYIDDKTRKKLDELLVISGEIASLLNQINELNKENKDIFEDQKRLRENLKSLGSSNDEKKLRERYVSELSKGEDRIRQIQDLIKQLTEKKNTLEKTLEQSINAFDITRDIK